MQLARAVWYARSGDSTTETLAIVQVIIAAQYRTMSACSNAMTLAGQLAQTWLLGMLHVQVTLSALDRVTMDDHLVIVPTITVAPMLVTTITTITHTVTITTTTMVTMVTMANPTTMVTMVTTTVTMVTMATHIGTTTTMAAIAMTYSQLEKMGKFTIRRRTTQTLIPDGC